MLNNDSSLRPSGQWKKFIFLASLLFCIGWWISGWFLKQVPNWWSVVFSLSLVIALWMMLRELRMIGLRHRQEEDGFTPRQNHTSLSSSGTDRALLAVDSAGVPSRSVSATEQSVASVRNYASVEDAQSHGWMFDEAIGTFGGEDLFGRANHPQEGAWMFDGLLPSHTVIMDKAAIAVGQVKYKRVD